MKINLEMLQSELLGTHTTIKTPYGDRFMTYADYTASGKPVAFIEKYLLSIEKYYANSHTEDSYTGKVMTELMHDAIKKMKKILNAENDYIIPAGTGATGAIQKLAEILGIYCPPALMRNIEVKDVSQIPVVFIGPYEHHSNDLLWREGLSEVVNIGLDSDGCIDLINLRNKVSLPEYAERKKIGSFSAASNVTGTITPVYEIAEIMHENNGYACFDFAASGPYVDLNMNHCEKSYFDAVYVSPHKFLGGPGSSGLLIINKRMYDKEISPTVAGGGTVDYVSAFAYDFTEDVEAREMAGTPGIMQLLRTCMAFELKDAIGVEHIESIERKYTKSALESLMKEKNIEILGNSDPENRISIISFNICYEDQYLHHRFVSRLLSDLFGIQSRAGCACAGPYGHKLLNIDDETSESYRDYIKKGILSLKPGWIRVNFHYIFTEAQNEFICNAIKFIAEKGYLFLQEYEMNLQSGAWNYTGEYALEEGLKFGIEEAFANRNLPALEAEVMPNETIYDYYLKFAQERANVLERSFKKEFYSFKDPKMDEKRWFKFQNEL